MSKLGYTISLWPFLIGLGIATVAALGLRAVSGLPLWGCLAIALGAMLINGWVAEWEDNQPGGFNNLTTDDRATPPHASTPIDPRSNAIRKD